MPPSALLLPLTQGKELEWTAELTITDDGRGFDPAAAPPDRLGLGILRERAQSIGADLSIESAPGQGTRVGVIWTRNQ